MSTFSHFTTHPGVMRLNGLPVFVTPDPKPRQVKFPRSKRRRIRAKWTRRSENWATGSQVIPDDQIIKTPQGLFVNPRMFERLKTALEGDPATTVLPGGAKGFGW